MKLFIHLRDVLVKIKQFEKMNKESISNTSQTLNRDFYIVMELLKPLVSYNYIISPKLQAEAANNVKQKYRLDKIKITNELGIYGVYLR